MPSAPVHLPTVKQLRYFVALAEHKHFGRAAAQCNVSQSAFSVAIRELVIRTPAGLLIPLRQVAEVTEIVGPRQITRENTQRFITIQTNVRERDIGSFVAEGQERIAEAVDLPSGYIVEWGGQFELQQEANRRLAIVVPITLGLVLLLLFMNFGSLRASLLRTAPP